MVEHKPRYFKCGSDIIGSPLWHDDGVLKLYFYCLCKVSHNCHEWRGLILQPGDLPLSERNAAKELEWSRNKLDRKLQLLIDSGRVSAVAGPKGTLLHVTDWLQSDTSCQLQNEATGSKTEPESTKFSFQSGSKTEPNQNNDSKYHQYIGRQMEADGFSTLWLAYPAERRTRREEAAKLFRMAIEEGATPEAMMMALEADKTSLTWTKENGQYIPGIVKWLQKEEWRDYLKTEVQEAGDIWMSR